MPSHSSKQHRFMEAIAHSPSFAKKAGVPQSVGKDFAAADKGKTFRKGGEMKESKAMVGKEVAFFKKKGAPKSMIKHEEAEMKGMKKGGRVRRMAEGGDTDMSMGYGDPFAKPRNYEAEKEQGAKNLRSIKNFLGFGDSSDEGERKPTGEQRKTVTPASYPTPKDRTIPAVNRASTSSVTSSSPVSKTNIAAEMEEREKGGERGSANKGPDYGDDSSPSTQIFKRSKPSLTSTPRRPKEISVEKEKTKVTASPSDQRSGPTEYEKEKEAIKRRSENDALNKAKSSSKFGLASDETRESIRRGLGRFADIFNLSKRHEQEFGKKAAKGGQVKKMASGGFTREADGVASKGKTQGKMVKMAGGGFVRSADGCAQRGKTKGAQVKMSRGGKC